METPEVPTQPDESAAVSAALGLGSAQAAPETPAPTPEPEAPFDPASITIPDRTAVNAPKAFEKFKNKSLADVLTSYESAEQAMHQKAQEAAQARREAEELRMKLAAAEQTARMLQAPKVEQPPASLWQREGVDPNQQIITDPERVLNTTLLESERRARTIAAEEAGKARNEIRAELARQQEEVMVINSFETAKDKLRKAGYQLTDEQWKEDLRYIAPVAAREGRIMDPDRLVEHFTHLRGPIKATLPTEGNPPVAAQPSAAPKLNVPTVTSEERAMRERLAGIWGMKGEDKKNYIERGGQA